MTGRSPTRERLLPYIAKVLIVVRIRISQTRGIVNRCGKQLTVAERGEERQAEETERALPNRKEMRKAAAEIAHNQAESEKHAADEAEEQCMQTPKPAKRPRGSKVCIRACS